MQWAQLASSRSAWATRKGPASLATDPISESKDTTRLQATPPSLAWSSDTNMSLPTSIAESASHMTFASIADAYWGLDPLRPTDEAQAAGDVSPTRQKKKEKKARQKARKLALTRAEQDWGHAADELGPESVCTVAGAASSAAVDVACQHKPPLAAATETAAGSKSGTGPLSPGGLARECPEPGQDTCTSIHVDFPSPPAETLSSSPRSAFDTSTSNSAPIRGRVAPEQVFTMLQRGNSNVSVASFDVAGAYEHATTAESRHPACHGANSDASYPAVVAGTQPLGREQRDTTAPVPVHLTDANSSNSRMFSEDAATEFSAAGRESLVEQQDKCRLRADVESFFKLRNLNIGETYLQILPPGDRWRLVNRLVTAVVWSDNGLADACLVCSLFTRAVSGGLVSQEEFVSGFLPVLDTLDIVASHANNPLLLIVVMLRGATLDGGHLHRLVDRAIGCDAELFIALLLPLDEMPPSGAMSKLTSGTSSANRPVYTELKTGCSAQRAPPEATTIASSLDSGGVRHGPLPAEPPHGCVQPTVLLCSSALDRARPIADLRCISYPEGIKPPDAAVNAGLQRGKYRYDRPFLMQFRAICTQRPRYLPPVEYLDDIGIRKHVKGQLRYPSLRGRVGHAAVRLDR